MRAQFLTSQLQFFLEEILVIAMVKINVRLKIKKIRGCRPPCRHIFHMINDISRMGRQGEAVSKFSRAQNIVPRFSIRVGADPCVCPHLGGHAGPPLQ
jgi:hypothetical protein